MDALCPFIVGANGMIIIYISNPFYNWLLESVLVLDIYVL